jgi:NHL repeat
MPIPSRPKYVLSGAVALIFLAACSGGGAGVPAQSSALSQQGVQNSSVLRPDVPQLHSNVSPTAFVSNEPNVKGQESIIVSDASNNVVDIFNASGKQAAQLTGFSQPQGLALDNEGNLYVADTNNSRIQVYAAGFNGTPTTINDPGEAPVGIAIDRNDNLAVTNIITTSDGPGSVSFFNKGGTLLMTLSSANFAKVLFDAFDRKGNLYIDGVNAAGAFVAGEVVGGVNGKSITVLATGNTFGYPGGIAISSMGKIVIDDQENRAIYTYNAPVKGSFGTPTATTPLTGSGDPISFTFARTNKSIWVADPAGGGPANKVLVPSADKYQYSVGGASTRAIFFSHGSQPTGVVLSQPAKS